MRQFRRYSTGMEVYPEISRVLAAEYSEMPAEAVEEIIARNFGEDVSPEDLEFSIGNALKAGGNVAQNVLPAVAPVAGAAIGTAYGGPVGGMIGGQLGTMAGRAIAPGRPAQPGMMPPTQPSVMPPTQPGVMPPTPAGQMMPAGGGSPSADQLLWMLFRPEVLQALMAMIMGAAGRPNVMVGNTPVPPGAVANTIATLANQAAAEYNAVAHGGESVPRYLLDERGEFLCDPAVPEERAMILVQRLNEAAHQEYWALDDDYDDYDVEENPEDDWYDELDLIDLYSEDWED